MSPTADSVVGMMDAAYFVGRKELLDFVNDTLGLRLQKIEQTASGAVACQLFDVMYPGTIMMAKVNWGARSDYEFVQNYKLLQGGFNRHHVQRHVDVDKLIRAKYQDNLEFMQWFKAFFEHSGGPTNLGGYRPHEIRARGKGGDKYNAQFGGGAAVSSSSSSASKFAAAAGSSRPGTGGGFGSSSSSAKPRSGAGAEPTLKAGAAATTNNPASPRQHRPLRERPQQQPATSAALSAKTLNQMEPAVAPEPDPVLASKVSDLEAQVQELQQKADDLEVAVMDIEKERDFYFEKLRNVEVLLQVYQESSEGDDPHNNESSAEDGGDAVRRPFPAELVDKIFKVLYATPEEEVIVTNDGEIVPADQLLSHDLSSVSVV